MGIKTKLIISAIAIATAIGGFILFNQANNSSSVDEPTETGEQFDNPITKDLKTQPNQDDTDQSTDQNLKTSPNIVINTPQTGDTLSDGSKVSGRTQSQDGKLYILLKGQQSGVLSDYSIDVIASDSNQPFSFNIVFRKRPQNSEIGFLELYTLKDGEKDHVTDVEVLLK